MERFNTRLFWLTGTSGLLLYACELESRHLAYRFICPWQDLLVCYPHSYWLT